ncbi:acyltransferase family protein [Actinoplanes sp. CA-051413]|uniref:acyltransferase family protein n=1 Tax=Actinoplanes sp. CA-051413 TaxID=3239899 RepID=UPI003D96A306
MSAAPRDRTIDAVRAYAIVGVVAGHWLVTGLVPGPDGVTTASPLVAMPGAAPATWLLQTLGLLFFAGGYSAACSARARRSGAASSAQVRRPAATATAAEPARRRRGALARLLRPATFLLAGWALVLFAGAALGTPTGTLRTIAGLVVSPLWFLLPYLALRAVTGPLSRVVRRLGVAAVLPPLVVVAAGDLGLLPDLVVIPAAWSIPWLFGMMLAGSDRRRAPAASTSVGTSPRPGAGPWVGAALACNGAAILAALILISGYPASAVGVPGGGRSNLDPPTLAAVALAVTQIGVFLMLRGPLARLLRHDRVRHPITALNRAAIPVYLGHQSVLLVVAGAAALLNPTMPGLLTAPDSAGWAWQRLAWLPALAGILAVATRGRHHGEPDYLKPRLRGTLFDGSRARTTNGGDRCAR